MSKNFQIERREFKSSLQKLIIILFILNSVQKSSALSFRADAGFEKDSDPDVFSGLGSYVRCSKSKVLVKIFLFYFLERVIYICNNNY